MKDCITTEEKLCYATAIIGVIAAASTGDATFNRVLLDDIQTAAQAVRCLLDQISEEVQTGMTTRRV